MGRVFDLEKFVADAKKIHGSKYDYSQAHKTKVQVCETKTYKLLKIICPRHGEFWQGAGNHRMGKGCPSCGKEATQAAKYGSKRTFCEKAKRVHGQTYVYTHVEYIDSVTDVAIKCRKHGIFMQRPNNHLMGKGCPQCAIEARPDYGTVTKKELQASGLKILTRMRTSIYHGEQIQVECSVHGKFTVKASSAVNGCYRCARQSSILKSHSAKITRIHNDFVREATKLYGDQFDYSKVDYVNAKTTVTVVCKEHGEFKASPNRITGGYSTGNIKNSPCPACRATGKIKQVRISDHSFGVRGYEDRALRFLIEEKGVSPDDIVVGKHVPKIPIRLKKKDGTVTRQHWPDIYIKSRNMLIEVKSTGTFGFTSFHGDASDRLRIIRHKSRRAKALGYDYRVLLFSGQKKKISRLPLPRNWDTMSLKELRDWFKQIATP